MKNFLISFAVLILLVILKVMNPYPLQVLELKSIDTTLRSKEITTNEDIVIIDVTDKTLEKLGQWPIDRKEFADMIERLRNYQAGVIVFPILFSEPDRSGHDNEFAKSVGSGGIVLAQVPTNQTEKPDAARRGFAAIGTDPLPFTYGWPGAVAPLKQFADNAAGVGVIASTPEVDGVVRRMPMVVSIAGQLYPSLPLEIIRTLTDDPSFQIKTGEAGIEAVRIPQFKTISTDANGRIWIDPSSRFKHVEFLDVKQEDVEGKLVILGVSASGVSSVVATPHGEKFVQDIQAQALLSVFAGTTPEREAIAPTVELLAVALLGILLIVVVSNVPVLWTLPLIIILPSIGYLQSYLFKNYNQLWDLSYVIIANFIVYFVIVAQRMISEYLQKLQIKKQFGTYLSPAMVEKLQKNPELLQLGGETRELSIMFTDVRGFTSISEHYGTDVQGLTKIMNRYMTAMTQSILDSNGTLDKYIGDAQMAFWNAPLDDTQHARHAVEAAVKMLGKLKEFNDEIAAEGVPPFGMGLGINTGKVVVGNMGSVQRFDYTCLGDNVNLASRLEGQSKNYGVQIILGPETANQVKSSYNVIELDCIAVKGKKEGVKIFTLIDNADWANNHEKTHVRFLSFYYEGDWNRARTYAKECKKLFNKKLEHYYDMMLERMEDGPPKNFDGVYRATSK